MAALSPVTYAAPRASHSVTTPSSAAAAKKGRATSCTSCRQVKLKCDLRAQHPGPCTRCKEHGSRCETDATFKRVPARSRVKDLENELESMKRARSLASSEPQSHDDQSVEQIPLRPSIPTEPKPHADLHIPGTHPIGAINAQPWLKVYTAQPWEAYSIGNAVLTGHDVLELFQQFELLYYPHFSILEPVDSLVTLAEQSTLLFWTIALVTARHHPGFQPQLDGLRNAHMQLYGKVCVEAIQSLHDLQAVLMLCAWPNQFAREQQDPSWMQLGMAVNAARHMGLDKATDEVLFGNRLARHSLSKHALSVRRMTWLKIFELDVQMSLWLGQPPTLPLHHYVSSIKQFCADTGVPRTYAAAIELHLHTAEYLDAVGGGTDTTISTGLMRQYSRALIDVKQRYNEVWNANTEVTFLGANLYLHALWLTKLGQNGGVSTEGGPSTSALEALHSARLAATKLVTTLTGLSENLLRSEKSFKHLQGSHPLPGHAKFDSRLAYFAAIVIIKYLDTVGNDNTPESEEARNAFSGIYHTFRQCLKSTKHFDATIDLELAGRAIGTGEAHIHDHVTTRMGASLMYNVVWTAAYLRGKDKDPAFTPGIAPSTESSAGSDRMLPQAVFPGPHLDNSTVGLSGSTQPPAIEQALSQSGTDNVNFPFGVWDDAVFDAWAGDAGMHFDPDLAMFDFNGQTFGPP